QDTNYVQYLLVKQLAAPQNNICVVGDDAQSIYSFRGADIRNILGFQQHYSSARLFKLEQNYRSTQTIVKAANSLIHHNQNQIYKEVFSEKPTGDRIDLTGYMSDRDEALGVAKEIAMESRRSKEKTYEDVAVLYRTNAQSRPIENELRKLGIPYRIYGGTSFYQRKEVKDAIAYFRLAINPKDNEALMRVINYPARGIGETTLRKISEHAILSQLSMLEVVQAPEETGLNVSAGTMKKLVGFGQMVTRFAEAADKMNAYDFAEMIMRESGVRTAAMLDRTPEGIDRAENLEELLNGIHELVDRRTEEGVDFTPIHDFMAEVALLTDQDQNLKDETRRVTLMTVHAAKGLEFPIVYIVGMEENLFPSQMCVRPAEIEEERRLLYVAITRAMERCHMSYARQRFRNGQTQFSSPSRFLNEIDYQFLSRHEGQTAMPQYGRAGGTPMWRTSDMWADRPQRPASPPPPPMPSVSTARMTKAAPAPKAVTTTTTATDDATWPAGTRIRHTVFGEGTVQRTYLDEMTGNEKIEIRFDRVGQKTLLLAYAKLERI
ncbi:MAG: UvrD-helicase domain-containing protein, partial [Paludibacteraceae bacterium]|nr:UvrD-helicase domain-containing protein [Paludibacteraceae bacterium]